MTLATGACTAVRIDTQSKDEVEITRHYGIVSLAFKPGARSVVVNSSTFGVINALDGLAIGYHSSSYAALAPDDCRIVLWIRTDEQLKELERLLRERTEICALPRPTSTGSKQ